MKYLIQGQSISSNVSNSFCLTRCICFSACSINCSNNSCPTHCFTRVCNPRQDPNNTK